MLSLKERFYKSDIGKALWMAYTRTNGFELTKDLNEKDILCEVFERIYTLLLPSQFNEKALQPFFG